MFLFLYFHLFFFNVIIATRWFQSQGLKMLRFRVMSDEVRVILSDLETTGRKRLFGFPRLQHANDLWEERWRIYRRVTRIKCWTCTFKFASVIHINIYPSRVSLGLQIYEPTFLSKGRRGWRRDSCQYFKPKPDIFQTRLSGLCANIYSGDCVDNTEAV